MVYHLLGKELVIVTSQRGQEGRLQSKWVTGSVATFWLNCIDTVMRNYTFLLKSNSYVFSLCQVGFPTQAKTQARVFRYITTVFIQFFQGLLSQIWSVLTLEGQLLNLVKTGYIYRLWKQIRKRYEKRKKRCLTINVWQYSVTSLRERGRSVTRNISN